MLSSNCSDLNLETCVNSFMASDSSWYKNYPVNIEKRFLFSSAKFFQSVTAFECNLCCDFLEAKTNIEIRGTPSGNNSED